MSAYFSADKQRVRSDSLSAPPPPQPTHAQVPCAEMLGVCVCVCLHIAVGTNRNREKLGQRLDPHLLKYLQYRRSCDYRGRPVVKGGGGEGGNQRGGETKILVENNMDEVRVEKSAAFTTSTKHFE